MPSVGTRIPFAQHAAGVPMQIEGLDSVAKLDFKGGAHERVVGKVSSGLGGVTLEADAFEMIADTNEMGRVTLTYSETPAPAGEAALVQDDPPTYRHTVRVNVALMIERPPRAGQMPVSASSRPLTYFNNSIDGFPIHAATYQLAEPVTFVDADNQVVATLQKFPVVLNHNP
jgi:hypothetical protein